MPKPIFQRSADTSLLVTLFGRATPGQLVTYDEIKEWIGRDPRKDRSAMYSAFRILHHETGAVFASVAGEGYRRLNDGEIVESTHEIRERQYRLSRKACKRLAVVDTEKLSTGQRRDYYANLSLHGAIQHVTSAKSQKAIASKVNGSTQQLAVAMTLKALAE